MTALDPTPSREVALTARLITLAAHARRRLAIQQWFAFIVRDLRWWFAVVVLAALARLTGYGLPTWSVWLIPAWLLLIALIAWRRVPATAGALARIDRALALDDLLLNAWDFSARHANGSFAKEHLRRADERLSQLDAARALPIALPLRHLAALVLLSLLLVSGFLAPLPPALPVVLDERQRDELTTQANELAREAAQIPTAALEEAEKAKLDELQQRIREAQEQAKRQGLTQPEVLKELDRLAHRAEDLAALLDQSDSPNAALLSELERHADTADLATALRAGDLAKAAAEAKALSERLARKDLTLDERRRLEQALDRAAKAATGDRSAAAEAVKQAQAAMQQGDPQQAGKALQKLAQNLAQRQQRQDAAKKMSTLANRLRSTGSRLLSSPAGALSKLPPGARSSGAPLAANSLPPARFQPGSKPGSGNRPGNGTPSGQPAKGQGKGQGQGQGQASIPVPGTGNGNAAGGAGSIPVPGSGAAGASLAGGVPGGSQAGNGHVKATGAATAPLTAAQTSTVTAASGEGHSEQVQVGGQVHEEGAARAVSQTPLTMVDAEERALDEDPLPAGRRAQVKAYFNLLREKLEP
jgi:hypothetical protein